VPPDIAGFHQEDLNRDQDQPDDINRGMDVKKERRRRLLGQVASDIQLKAGDNRAPDRRDPANIDFPVGLAGPRDRTPSMPLISPPG